MYVAARLIQFLGLVIAGSALFVGLFGHNVRRELLLLAVGAGVFLSGYALQRGAR
jgi:hypothetical protein